MRSNNTSLTRGATIAFFLLLSVVSCRKDSHSKRTFIKISISNPIYKSKAAFQATINGDPQEPVKVAGKLYIKDQFIYLNEVDKGIHIIDNSNPSKPNQIAFLELSGNRDIAIKGNTLYADMNADLLALDISNPKKVTMTDRVPGFFTSRLYQYGYVSTDTSRIIVGWTKKDTLIENYYSSCWGCQFDYALANASAATSGGRTGTAGSMASMVLMNDYLYAITEPHSVGIVDISTASNPKFVSNNSAGFDLETIYPFEGKLFMGSVVGMFIYDVSDPKNPKNLGTFSHGRACDPVVTDGHYAFVTLRTGTNCGGSDNELNVVDIKDLMNPVLVKSYSLTKPTGLTKDGNLLFVCDDASGVRIYDAADISDLKLLQQVNIKKSYDVLAGNKHALIVTADGLYQYDYSDLNHIRELSFFSLKN